MKNKYNHRQSSNYTHKVTPFGCTLSAVTWVKDWMVLEEKAKFYFWLHIIHEFIWLVEATWSKC